MYLVKKLIDLDKIPFVNSNLIFGIDKSVDVNTTATINTNGLNKLLTENQEIITNVHKRFDEIRPETFIEFIKPIDSENIFKDPKISFSEFKKSFFFGLSFLIKL